MMPINAILFLVADIWHVGGHPVNRQVRDVVMWLFDDVRLWSGCPAVSHHVFE